MKKYVLFIGLLVSLSACKTMRSITSKDNSTNSETKKRDPRKIVFIEGIEILPGSVVRSSHKPNTTKDKSTTYEVPIYLLNSSTVEIEKASSMQIKYALILDTYIENISNINLFLNIDEWWGTNYCLGGSTKNCIDFSGFTSIILKNVYRIQLSRTAAEQYKESTIIEKEELKEGDLVFFKTKNNYINHVGIFLTNDKFVHASTSLGVTISDLKENYWQNRFAGCGRVIN